MAGAAAASAAPTAGGVVGEGDWVFLQFQDERRNLTQVVSGQPLKGARLPDAKPKELDLGALVGMPWGQAVAFDPQARKLVRSDGAETAADVISKVGVDAGNDNRALIDDNSAQKTSIDKLMKTRDGTSGAIEELIAGSASFASKTKFSQEKYVKKKQKKWTFSMTILKPNMDLLLEHYSWKKAEKMMGMRHDTLAGLLHHANIAAGQTSLVFDTVCGVAASAVVERTGGVGAVYNVVMPGRGTPFVEQNAAFMHHQAWGLETVKHITMVKEFGDVLAEGAAGDADMPAAAEAKAKKGTCTFPQLTQAAAIDQLRAVGGADSCVIATNHDPVEAFFALLPLMGGSCNFAVYNRYAEPLAHLQRVLRKHRVAVNATISENWLRRYQVLPERTHPFVNMSAASGYILSGIVVESTHPASYGQTLGKQVAEEAAAPASDEPAAKRAKTDA